MAILIEKEISNSGVISCYWRVVNGFFDFLSDQPTLTLNLVGYKDKHSRLNGSNPIPTANFMIVIEWVKTLEYITNAGGNLEMAMYNIAKDHPFFSGATDDL